MAKTHLAETIDAAGAKAEYDAACKQILAHRQILAHVLKGALREYAGASISEIEGLIRGDPNLFTTPVHGSEIAGGPSEDTRMDDGTVFYDLLFETDTPDSQTSSAVMVNIEMQRSLTSWKRLICRSYYYCARMISSQRGRVFSDNSYDKMHKVVSVWICPHSLKTNSTVTELSMSGKPLVGLWVPKKADFDLVETVIIRLGDPDHSTGLSRMLSVLFSREMEAEEKKRVLEDEYNIGMTNELKDEVSRMSGMGEALWQEALQEGVEQGIEQGIERGIEQGIESGKAQERAAMLSLMKELGVDEGTIRAVADARDHQ